MRVERWNPEVLDDLVNEVMPERLVEAAEVIAANVRLHAPEGTISRPMYKRGPYAGQFWTARDAGQLKRSVRVVQKKGKSGRLLWKAKNIRVYAGHAKAWYASIVEYYRPFMRPAFYAALSRVKEILGGRGDARVSGQAGAAPRRRAPASRPARTASPSAGGGITWRQFTSERMGPYMQRFGGHGPAIRQIAKEWKAYKASRGAR